MKKIVQKYDECIGCGSCAVVCPEFWEMDDEGKAKLKGGIKDEEGNYNLEIEEVGCNEEAAAVCPVDIIKIL